MFVLRTGNFQLTVCSLYCLINNHCKICTFSKRETTMLAFFELEKTFTCMGKKKILLWKKKNDLESIDWAVS